MPMAAKGRTQNNWQQRSDAGGVFWNRLLEFAKNNGCHTW